MTFPDSQAAIIDGQAAGGGRALRRWVVIALAAAGVIFYLLGGAVWREPRLVWPGALVRGRDLGVILLAAALCWPKMLRQPLTGFMEHIRHPSARRRRLATLWLWAGATLFFWAVAALQGRDLTLRTQDEMMYLVQTQQVAAGHLWMPAHPMADFFQTFYLFVRPVYAAMHFPGTAILYAPTVWFGIPPWALSLVLSGAVVAMTFRVVCELADGVAGGLAAALVAGLSNFRAVSVMVMPYVPMALLVLLLVWAYLRWRRACGLGWAAAIGALLGMGLILRPLDAVCFGLPVVAAMLWDLRGGGWRRGVATVLLSAACAVPFGALQLIANHGITGHWLRAPVQQYQATFWPAVKMGFPPRIMRGHFGSPTSLPQFKANYDDFIVPMFTRNAQTFGLGMRWAQTLNWGLPSLLLATLAAVGLTGLRERRRWVWAGGLLLFPLAYLSFLYVPLYAAIVAPGLAFLVAIGVEQAARAFGGGRRFVSAWLALAVAGLALAGTPLGGTADRTTRSPAIEAFNAAARWIQRPAVVFFRYDPEAKDLWRHEQTYNFQAARIDDAPIVRAQDLGDRNPELIAYYAKAQPGRTIYVFDQAKRQLERLGTAGELAARGQ